jgi:hypothetical protein
MKRSMALVLAVLLTGCEASVTDVRGPNGESAHVIRCSASESCYRKADEICESGYVLHSTAISTHPTLTTGSEILVSCKPG